MPSALGIVRKYFPNVRLIKDAKQDVWVEVTSRDTQLAEVRNHKACAMAVACKRQLHVDGVLISRAIAYLVRENQATRFMVPENVAREIIAFDRGGDFMPGAYRLRRPDLNSTLREMQKRGGVPPIKSKHGKHGKPRHYTKGIRASFAGK